MAAVGGTVIPQGLGDAAGREAELELWRLSSFLPVPLLPRWMLLLALEAQRGRVGQVPVVQMVVMAVFPSLG